MTHVLGDGDDYVIGVTLPSGHALSVLVYVDHNLGTVVKDAFVIPEPLEDLAITMGTLIEDPDQVLTRTDPAGARAAVEAAIDSGAQLYPPLTSDSWPMCRPLVEWMLPTGGAPPDWREWTEQEQAEVAEAFFASPYGTPLDREDERGLLESVLWLGTSYAPGDPLRWSPVSVEMLLADRFPRKVIAEPAYLAKLPTHPENLAARAFVARLRGELADLFASSGAVSFQIGKFYRYRPSQHASSLALLDALKNDLDPHGLMNPGALGFPA